MLPPRFPSILVVIGLLAYSRAQGATNVFSTGFELSEGYSTAYELAGQNNWTKDRSGSGGNGVLPNAFGSRAAYVGVFPLNPKADWVSVWRPINFAPALSLRPILEFSTILCVVDSTTDAPNRDYFDWSVYNTRGDRLFTLDFDNAYLTINYALDGTNNFQPTGMSFTNDVAYTLRIRMDLAANRWSASLDDQPIATNLPLTTVASPLDLGDIDAVWAMSDPNAPGDNFMAFDDYQITVEYQSARLVPLGRIPSGWFLLQLYGPSGSRYAVDGSTNLTTWIPLKTNLLGDVPVDVIDTTAGAFNQRFYRARLVP
jgi:hypothetical protein